MCVLTLIYHSPTPTASIFQWLVLFFNPAWVPCRAVKRSSKVLRRSRQEDPKIRPGLIQAEYGTFHPILSTQRYDMRLHFCIATPQRTLAYSKRDFTFPVSRCTLMSDRHIGCLQVVENRVSCLVVRWLQRYSCGSSWSWLLH